MNKKERIKKSHNAQAKFFRKRKRIMKIIESWDQSKKSRGLFKNIDMLFDTMILYCYQKYGVRIAHNGSFDPKYYAFHLGDNDNHHGWNGHVLSTKDDVDKITASSSEEKQ